MILIITLKWFDFNSTKLNNECEYSVNTILFFIPIVRVYACTRVRLAFIIVVEYKDSYSTF